MWVMSGVTGLGNDGVFSVGVTVGGTLGGGRVVLKALVSTLGWARVMVLGIVVGTLGGWRVLCTGGSTGRARLRMVAILRMASRVSSVIVRHGAAGAGLLRMLTRSCAALRKRFSVVTSGKGMRVGTYWTVSAILMLFALGT